MSEESDPVAYWAAQGFVPLEDLTGNLAIAALWPDQHRRGLPETRPEYDDEWHDGQRWLVRSPWTSITLDELFERLLWSWVERAPFDPAAEAERIREVLSWSEAQAQDWLERNPPQTTPEPERPSAALRDQLTQLLSEHAVRLEQQLRDLGGELRPGMYVVVPYRFDLITDGVMFRGLPLMSDLVDQPAVRAYKPIT